MYVSAECTLYALRQAEICCETVSSADMMLHLERQDAMHAFDSTYTLPTFDRRQARSVILCRVHRLNELVGACNFAAQIFTPNNSADSVRLAADVMGHDAMQWLFARATSYYVLMKLYLKGSELTRPHSEPLMPIFELTAHRLAQHARAWVCVAADGRGLGSAEPTHHLAPPVLGGLHRQCSRAHSARRQGHLLVRPRDQAKAFHRRFARYETGSRFTYRYAIVRCDPAAVTI
ncbi:hypothetical protein PHLGIDRAFT_516100 [Phlebiopsis gigantea 11061_1 CR5-6]|uniref:Uncharacterized protein n=1 Tax=Phlebiopsis gigantea (strain 11061_1 CR5-6) TaxID=745531 RepID=A0A0C3S9D7_PHLG1|nr:hypothetical protein PHLGIDRAFT_516100 [Phlebiopsis gigantea 11061_1 CR5-6]